MSALTLTLAPNGEPVTNDDLFLCEACVQTACEILGAKPAQSSRQLQEIRRLEIENRQIVIDAQVMSSMPLSTQPPSPGGVKVGVQFIRISPEDSDYLVSFIARGLALRI